MVRNVHERTIGISAGELGRLLDRLGGPHDVLWPSPAWQPMVLDGPVAVGAAGGHGPFRYGVTAHEPGRLVEFTAAPGRDSMARTRSSSTRPGPTGRCCGTSWVSG